MTFFKILETSIVHVQFDCRLSCLTFLCATESRVLFSAHSNEKSCFCAADYFSPAGVHAVYLRSAPSCLRLCLPVSQRGLSQLEGECMPGRLLPPHQACPLAPSVSPSFLQSDSHTAWIILLPLFFCLFTPSNSLPEKPGHYSMLTKSPRVSEHM